MLLNCDNMVVVYPKNPLLEDLKWWTMKESKEVGPKKRMDRHFVSIRKQKKKAKRERVGVAPIIPILKLKERSHFAHDHARGTIYCYVHAIF